MLKYRAVWIFHDEYLRKEFFGNMDEGGSCCSCNVITNNQLNDVSITCILKKKMPAMLFLLKKRLNL